MKKYFAIAIFATFACGPESGVIYVDNNFTSDEKLAIEEAAKAWNDSTNGHAHVELVYENLDDDDDDSHVKMVSVNQNDIRLEFSEDLGEHKNYYKGFHLKTEILIRNDTGFEHDEFRRVVIHELGHYFGVPHISEPSAIMYAKHGSRQANCLTRADVEAYATYQQIFTGGMSWCLDN